MSGPRSEVRTWRAWACWSIACIVNPDDPADEKQIVEEGIVEPGEGMIVERLESLGWKGEFEGWEGAIRMG